MKRNKKSVFKFIKIIPIAIFSIAIIYLSLFISGEFLSPESSISIDTSISYDDTTYSNNAASDNDIASEPASATTLSISSLDYSSLSYNEALNLLYNSNYSLENRITAYLGNNIDNIGLIYYNLENNNTISINEDKSFIAASTYKVGLNLYAYYLSSFGDLNLDEYIQYIPSDYEEGTGILQNEYYIGSYTIQDLLDLSIIYSDNIATNMLGRYLGGHENVRSSLYALLDIDLASDENIITPLAEYKILKYIYENRSAENFSHLIKVLTESEYTDRLARYLDPSIVAHKIGTYDSYIHDVGIILDDSPYIVIIYTYDLDNSEEIIANISNAIYQYNNSTY